jgi:malonyl-CoA O-methyltransferase
MSDTPTLPPKTAYALWAESYPPEAHNPLMQAEERAMLSLLPDSLRGCTVLDAGCGSGRYLRQARQRGAKRLIGVDLSVEMLARAHAQWGKEPGFGEHDRYSAGDCCLLQAGLESLPLRDDQADVTLCGLTLGHLDDLDAALSELQRVTRPGGLLLCSDVHPIGPFLGWQRTFMVEGHRYAVTHTVHLYSDWHRICRKLHLHIETVLEPFLDPADLPAAPPDPRALEVPVALIFALRREEK